MKRKRLELKRDTVRNLTVGGLRQVYGGSDTPVTCDSCGCDITRGCNITQRGPGCGPWPDPP
jgi:hypothetical protein